VKKQNKQAKYLKKKKMIDREKKIISDHFLRLRKTLRLKIGGGDISIKYRKSNLKQTQPEIFRGFF